MDEVVSVNDDANLVARVKLECRALTHHNEVSHLHAKSQADDAALLAGAFTGLHAEPVAGSLA